MCTLITLVGQQPGAVAATAKTLFLKEGLKKIILLPTEETAKESFQIVRFLETFNENGRRLERYDIITYFINTDPQIRTSHPFAWETIRYFLKKGDLPEPVYYDTSPGLNYQVALIAHHLRDKPLIPLYADYTHLFNLNDPKKFWPLENTGTNELLNLHGYSEDRFKAEWKKRKIPLLHITEKFGRLYGLTKIWRDLSLKSQKDYEKESDRIKQTARQIEALLQFPKVLNNLQPRIFVWTNSKWVNARLRAFGIEPVWDEKAELTDEQAVQKWERLTEKPPGWLKPGGTENKFNSWGTYENSNGYWKEKNLIVSLGNDPSSTLLAIYTHQPSHLILLVDKHNPWVQSMAGRIYEHRLSVPAKKITFFPFDLKGQINIETLASVLSEEIWSSNISPGTKAHTWVFAQLQGVEIWSLNNKIQSAIKLGEETGINTKSYSFPPIHLQAQVVGGKLQDFGFSQKHFEKKKVFLKNIGEIISEKTKESGKLEFIDINNNPILLPWSKGHRLWLDNENYVQCLEIDSVNKRIKFQVRYKGVDTSPDYIKGDPAYTGLWLEEPVACGFWEAGKYSIKDIRAGLRWAWLHEDANRSDFRTDLDILLNWEGVYLGISCKSHRANYSDKAEIMAEARAGLGRFALPVIVTGGIKYAEAKQIAEKSIRDGGPLEIGLCLLNESNQLKELTEKAIKNLRTLEDD